ncbi:hypothetical protein GF318_05530 [Candidatus Micrarchaeota archaeon]|nr:hypothetical protein [Candidatus Micrarchaeota archaeon]
MGLPDVIATAEFPEREGTRRPYQIFRELVLTGANVYQDYTLTTGKGHYDERGAFVLEDTGNTEHIHHYDKDEEKTGRLLASVRTEERFGRRFYILEIYDREFAQRVESTVGGVEFLAPEREDEDLVAGAR